MEHRWYAIQTTAGHENKVRSLIQRKIEHDPLPPEARSIRQALVPTQEVVEIKNGKKVTVERKIYPGYVLVEMLMTQETLHVINGIQGVIKFVGHDRLPQPLRTQQLQQPRSGLRPPRSRRRSCRSRGRRVGSRVHEIPY